MKRKMTGNINIRFNEDDEREKRIMEFLFKKNANKFIITEALEMYMDAYENMNAPKTAPTQSRLFGK